jgi:hypothetical protein
MELYAAYIKEREGKEVLFDDNAFIVYKIYGKEISLIDIFISKEKRNTFALKTVFKKLLKVIKDNDIETAYGYTDPNTIGWEKSERMMINYGFKKMECEGDYNHYILNLKKE